MPATIPGWCNALQPCRQHISWPFVPSRPVFVTERRNSLELSYSFGIYPRISSFSLSQWWYRPQPFSFGVLHHNSELMAPSIRVFFAYQQNNFVMNNTRDADHFFTIGF
jgi:hypothetical protein